MVAAKRPKPKSVGKAASSTSFTEFVNCRLDPAHEQEAARVSNNSEELWAGTVALLETGYKLSASYQFERGSFTVAWTCRNEESVNAGKTLSSFGKTLKDALAASLVKHYVQLEQDWTSVASAETSRFG